MTKFEIQEPIRIGIIGGSGLYSLDGLQVLGELEIKTPWGLPSDNIVIGVIDGDYVAFLARHGRGHHLTPTEVNSRANIAALKSIGVDVILAFSAVGSLREEIMPRHFVLPSQIIDRTKHRVHTYFGEGIVAHVGFANPFSNQLASLVQSTHKQLISELPNVPKLHTGKTLVCMEGPAFSTRAESEMYRQLGGDLINMSVVPEAKLAREAEIVYQMICMSTDYDCWRVEAEAVTVQEVMKTMEDNSKFAKVFAAKLVGNVGTALKSGGITSLEGSTRNSIMTAVDKRPKESVQKLQFLFPDL